MSLNKETPLVPVILPNHHTGKTTVVYAGYIANGCQFFSKRNKGYVFDNFNVSDAHREDVNRALNAQHINIKQVIGIDDKALIDFAFNYFKKVKKDVYLKQLILQTNDADAIDRLTQFFEDDPIVDFY